MLRDELRQLIALVDRLLGTDFLWAQQLARRVTPRVASGHARIKVFLAGVLFGSQRWRRPITLSLDGPDGRIPFTVTDYAGYKVLHEVFYGGEYDVDLPEAPHSILDLGGHVGASVLFFRRKWPSADVMVVEANPRLVPVLRANLRTLGVTVRHAAVAAHEGTTGFMRFRAELERTYQQDGERVPAITLDQLLDGPVDLMKIDIEGAELRLCRLFSASNARVVVGELHARQGSAAVDGALDAFEGFDVASVPTGRVRTRCSGRFMCLRKPARRPVLTTACLGTAFLCQLPEPLGTAGAATQRESNTRDLARRANHGPGQGDSLVQRVRIKIATPVGRLPGSTRLRFRWQRLPPASSRSHRTD